MVEHLAVDITSSTDIPAKHRDKDEVRPEPIHENGDRTRVTAVRFCVGGYLS